MFKLLKLSCTYKYYKQIAEILNMQVFKINQDITQSGSCFVYDRNKTSHRTMSIDEARLQAKEKGEDLLLIKEGFTPYLQIKPYVYQVYKNFFTQLKKPKFPKSIPLSAKIMQHDISNKIQIARNLFRKGYGELRLIGTDDTDENLKVIEKFIGDLGEKGDTKFELEKLHKGKKGSRSEYERWTCLFSLKELRPSINYELLDKRYLRMYKHNVSMNDIKERNVWNAKRNSREEEEEEEDEDVGFATRREGQEFFFRLIKGEVEDKGESKGEESGNGGDGGRVKSRPNWKSRGKVPSIEKNQAKQIFGVEQKGQEPESESWEDESGQNMSDEEIEKLASMSPVETDAYIQEYQSRGDLTDFEREKIRILKELNNRRGGVQ